MAQTGHLSKRTTDLYTHINNRALQEAAERYAQKKAESMNEARKRLKGDLGKQLADPVN